jgi:hypothetical protein
VGFSLVSIRERIRRAKLRNLNVKRTTQIASAHCAIWHLPSEKVILFENMVVAQQMTISCLNESWTDVMQSCSMVIIGLMYIERGSRKLIRNPSEFKTLLPPSVFDRGQNLSFQAYR